MAQGRLVGRPPTESTIGIVDARIMGGRMLPFWTTATEVTIDGKTSQTQVSYKYTTTVMLKPTWASSEKHSKLRIFGA